MHRPHFFSGHLEYSSSTYLSAFQSTCFPHSTVRRMSSILLFRASYRSLLGTRPYLFLSWSFATFFAVDLICFRICLLSSPTCSSHFFHFSFFYFLELFLCIDLPFIWSSATFFVLILICFCIPVRASSRSYSLHLLIFLCFLYLILLLQPWNCSSYTST